MILLCPESIYRENSFEWPKKNLPIASKWNEMVDNQKENFHLFLVRMKYKQNREQQKHIFWFLFDFWICRSFVCFSTLIVLWWILNLISVFFPKKEKKKPNKEKIDEWIPSKKIIQSKKKLKQKSQVNEKKK